MTQYPNLYAGQRLTSGLLQSMQPAYVLKPSSTSRASNITFTDDPDLTFNLAGNATYFIEYFIKYSTIANNATAGIKFIWNVPLGASGTRLVSGAGDAQSEANLNNVPGKYGVHGYTTSVGYGSRASATNQAWAFENSLMTTSSAGPCTLQWAQIVSNATASVVFSGSFMRITRLV